ncbi:MAG: hypothetical protein A3B11_01950 [Candidatus Taylorbacteria bacterium RIFCSPLOWO2_01_FULL_44_26]|uniref:Signal transduction histidine kinase dimerisation/phosphoacceptor domain-containing protein n=2 Tax=Candidatus Tayloriibacteriota TaxID=1817919 RepID=A0A1G2ML81_9BACT|nr:MAG: hypothetical protein A3D50_01945 [Candidatus Taylorbacteria bacterium RIFCSPHIGHO2_02_FULL_44_12]OHA31437.1 MAG: hypothetical protein A3B11_01950 [Candidatus Taylorbacteria bacterium RIFCSPLOWO2_01_FULL_44_26]
MLLIEVLRVESVGLIIAMVIDIILIIIIFLKKHKSLSTIFFLLFTIFVLFWVLSMFLFDNVDSSLLILVTHFLYAFPAFIPPLLLFFIITFPDKKLELSWKQIVLISLPTLFVAFGSFIPNFVITHVTPDVINGSRNIFYGKIGYGIYFSYIVIYFFIVLVKILERLLKSKNKEHDQIEIIFISILISCLIGVVFSLFLPTFGIYRFMWIGPFFSIYMVSTIAYAIAKYQLFDIKLVAIESVTLTLWIFILIRIFLATNAREIWIEVILLIITIAFGILLIRSALHEMEQREKIETMAFSLKKAYTSLEELNKGLKQKVSEQTKEIRASYEVEKRARGELEKLDETKNQLITAAQHNLRTPLTTLKWQLEEIRKNSNDGSDNGLNKALKESEESVTRLTQILEDFLRITEMKVSGK